MSLEHLIVLTLSTWRLSSLLVQEAGPWNIFLKIRTVFSIVHDDNDVAISWPSGFFQDILTCVWCASVWVAIFTVVLWSWVPELTLLVMLPFALSAGAIVINDFTRG